MIFFFNHPTAIAVHFIAGGFSHHNPKSIFNWPETLKTCRSSTVGFIITFKPCKEAGCLRISQIHVETLQLFQPYWVLLDQLVSFGGKRGGSYERSLVVTQTGIYCVLRNIGLCSVDAEMTAVYQNWTMFKEAQRTAIKACIYALPVSARAESQTT